ncbi:MAG: transcriptional repressor [Bacteroidetes bacterium]|nr:transcriptional repressor [Bacteroidota bacterium]
MPPKSKPDAGSVEIAVDLNHSRRKSNLFRLSLNNTKTMETARQKFEDYLREENYRVTPERFEVLDAVMATSGHFDADELFLTLKKTGSKVSRATVYNTLDILEECELVFKTRLKDHGSRFEKAFGRSHHDHLVCVKCGKIVEFVDDGIEQAQQAIAKRFKFTLISHSHQIFGLCPDCKNVE